MANKSVNEDLIQEFVKTFTKRYYKKQPTVKEFAKGIIRHGIIPTSKMRDWLIWEDYLESGLGRYKFCVHFGDKYKLSERQMQRVIAKQARLHHTTRNVIENQK